MIQPRAPRSPVAPSSQRGEIPQPTGQLSGIVGEVRRLIWNALQHHERTRHHALVTGKVSSVTGSPTYRASVFVSGASVATDGIPWLSAGVTYAYTPTANDEVYLLRTKASYVIIGKRV